MISLFDFMTQAQKDDVSASTLGVDVSSPVQDAIDYAYNISGSGEGGATLYAPRGRYRMDSPVTPRNMVDTVGEPGYGGTVFVANNPTGCFLTPGLDSARFRRMGFSAINSGIGTASAIKGTNYAGQIARCIFDEVDLWADLGFGFNGNFIASRWLKGVWGYFGMPGSQFCPIYCKGDVASGAQVNTNVVDGQYIFKSKGTDTLYFEYGSNVKFRDLIFEGCTATWLIQALGMLVVTIDGYYVEGGSGGSSLFKFANDSLGSGQGTYSISVKGGLVGLLSNNIEMITLGGASGGIDFNNNVVTGPGNTMAGKHISGNDDVFSAYYNNSTPGLTVVPTPIPGRYPTVISGTVAGVSGTPSTLFDASVHGAGLYTVSAFVHGLGAPFQAEGIVNYDGTGNVSLLQSNGGLYMTITTSGTLVRGTLGGGGAPQTISWAATRMAQ